MAENIASTASQLMAEMARKKREAAAITTAGQSEDAARRAALDTRVSDIRGQNETAKQTAVSALMQQMMDRGEQAKRTLANAPTAPSITPNAAPLKQITGVSLTPELAGANAAKSAFFLSPEASQAQFAVGAPVGGGGIGRRQRGTTERITSDPDNLNSGRKGDF
jgi:DNA polymerase II small subunit/DNA polymerase delta subunit B